MKNQTATRFLTASLFLSKPTHRRKVKHFAVKKIKNSVYRFFSRRTAGLNIKERPFKTSDIHRKAMCPHMKNQTAMRFLTASLFLSEPTHHQEAKHFLVKKIKNSVYRFLAAAEPRGWRSKRDRLNQQHISFIAQPGTQLS